MKIKLHLPRPSEADLHPELTEDIVVKPRFYKQTGWTKVLYITVEDAKGKSEQYIMSVSATTKNLKVDKLKEVVPTCDTRIKMTKPEIANVDIVG